MDLDDTLHDAANGTLKNIDFSMIEAIKNLLGIDRKNANLIRKKYWSKYGATVVGLNKLHNVSISEFLNNSHPPEILSNLKVDSFRMSTRIKRLNGARWLITNSPEKYAILVLKKLKIKKCFDKIISIEKMKGPGGLKPKPLIFQWKKLIRLAGVPASEVTVVDDCLRNLRSAKKLGCETIWAQCFKSKDKDFKVQISTPLFVDKKIKNLSGLLRI